MRATGCTVSDLVVHPHHRDQRNVRAERFLEPRRLDDAVAPDRHHRQREAARFEVASGLEHRGMLDGRDHEPPARRRGARDVGRSRQPLEGQVVGLRSRSGEDDLLGRCADQRATRARAASIASRARLAPAVHRGGVAETLTATTASIASTTSGAGAVVAA
jgi:hypothetical protein